MSSGLSCVSVLLVCWSVGVWPVRLVGWFSLVVLWAGFAVGGLVGRFGWFSWFGLVGAGLYR